MPLVTGESIEREGEQESLAPMLRFRKKLSQLRSIFELDYKAPYHILRFIGTMAEPERCRQAQCLMCMCLQGGHLRR